MIEDPSAVVSGTIELEDFSAMLASVDGSGTSMFPVVDGLHPSAP